MSLIFVFLFMIFAHIVDDFYLQGILAKLKQKSWWIENAPDSLYEHDYIMALILHSFSWTFMVMLPIAIYNNFQCDVWFLFIFLLNTFYHARMDNLKANKKEVGLIIDQSFHLIQIILTFLFLVIWP